MATPRVLYRNLLRVVRQCERTTHDAGQLSSKNARAPFHTTRRQAQETYHRRYGPAAEANIPPPPRPKDESSRQAVPQAAPRETNTPPNTSPPEKLPPDPKPNLLEPISHAQDPTTSESKNEPPADDATGHEEPTEDSQETDQLSASVDENPSEERPEPRDSQITGSPLDGVFHMPSPSSYLTPSGVPPTSDQKPPLTPPPYIHHFDTFSLVRDLSKGGFTEDQSVTIMKAVRNILHNNLDLARQNLTSKSDVENESYLFKAACSELQSSLQTARNSEMQRQRASRTQLQHEADIVSQRMNQELAGLKDDIKGMFNDHKMTTREQQRSIDTSVQELNYKITVSLNSDGKSEIEGLRWILTRRAALAIATSAFMIISFLKFYSSRKAQDAADKKKEAPTKEPTVKPGPKEPVIGSAVPVPEVHLTESLG